MDKIETYYNTLEEVIKEKKLNNFWLIYGKSEFKPILLTREQIKKKVKEKKDQFKNKYICNVKLLFSLVDNFNNLDKNKKVFMIHIYIYKINEDGVFDTGFRDTWTLSILYNADELKNNHFTFDELTEMIQIAQKKKILTDLGGMSYTEWLERYNKLKKSKKSSSKRHKSK